MKRKELEKLAHEAIDHWFKDPQRPLSGEPYIKVVNAQPMVPAFPIRWSCITIQSKYYVSMINAQDTLDYFTSLERIEPKELLPKAGVFK
jgi:hypothetical protein